MRFVINGKYIDKFLIYFHQISIFMVMVTIHIRMRVFSMHVGTNPEIACVQLNFWND